MSEILKPLIENASEAGVKPVVQKDGNSILFQREIEAPKAEPLEDVFDELDDNINATIKNSTPLNEDISREDFNINQNSYFEVSQDYSPSSKSSKKSKRGNNKKIIQNEEEEDSKEQEKKGNIFDFPTTKLEKSQAKAKTTLNLKIKKPNLINKKKSTPSPPKNVSSTNSANKSKNSSTKRYKKTSTYYGYNPGKTRIFEILIYCFIILAILIGIIVSNYDANEEENISFNEFELDAITRLNDCVNPIDSIPISNYPPSFIEFVQSDSSKYLKYDSELQAIVIKKPHQTLFCKAVNFGDHHPDLSGIFIVWMIFFIYYMHYSVSRARAERIAPDVMNLLKSNRMCYLDEAKKKMKENGYWLFGAWWQVVKIINNNNDVKTVKMVDTKPFWSLDDN